MTNRSRNDRQSTVRARRASPLRDRRSVRLKRYDYAEAGAYFVTICTRGRLCLFGNVDGVEVRLSNAGQIAEACWQALPEHFPNVASDAFVVMPNHVHGIIMLNGPGSQPVGATHASPPHASPPPRGPAPKSIGAIVGSYKSAVSKQVNALHITPAATIWQRNYYEHVVRNGESLNRIRQYIADNPARWAFDRENPAATEPEPEDARGQ